jgi:hypothetical protein
MADWSNFYMLAGGVAGTLIGLIFVVLTLGAERGKAGDADRTRIFITPVLVHFASVLLIALAMVAPVSNPVRASLLGLIGCAGLAYAANLALLARTQIEPAEREPLWDGLLPIAAYVCLAIAAAAFALGAAFADGVGAIASMLLLVTALRKDWAITLAIVGRPKP